MNNNNQMGNNQQLNILNNLGKQMGVNQNNSPFLSNDNSQVNQSNQTVLPNNNIQMNNQMNQNDSVVGNQVINNSNLQGNMTQESRFFQNVNTPVGNPSVNQSMTNSVSNPVNVIPSGTSILEQGINGSSNGPQIVSPVSQGDPFSNGNTYVDPRRKELNDNNFDKDVPKNGFVDILKEGGVNIQAPQNKFINSDSNFNETSINDLNISGEYNKLQSIDYSNDPKVIENINNQKKKNTVKLSKELQTFFLICAILFVFIFIMPYIFDFFRDIQSR